MSRVQDFSESIEAALRELLRLCQQSEMLEKAFFDNAYNVGGSKEIVDADVEHLGISASELGDGINLLTQFNNLLNNRTVTQGDWKAVINKIRRTFKKT